MQRANKTQKIVISAWVILSVTLGIINGLFYYGDAFVDSVGYLIGLAIPAWFLVWLWRDKTPDK